MYEAFYGLNEKPFNLTPDPKYLYLSEKHKEAFAHLLFGIKNRSGFVMVTGEIGTGKTTICRNLLNQLDEDTELAFVFNPSLNPVELLKRINSEFGVETSAATVLELTDVLNQYLLEAAAQGKRCVLVIDEAQNLTPPVLEQIRLLSNLETETEKLLQIILIGQPELVERLELRELRQLNQRITARYHLRPLNEKETLQYIAYRLHVAGGRRKVRFAKPAIHAVYKYSGGTPRVINAICDRALLIGYTREAHTITKAIVKRAAREIRGEKIARRKRARREGRQWMPSPSFVVAVLLAVALVYYLARPMQQFAHQLGVFNTLLTSDDMSARELPGEENTASATADVAPVPGAAREAAEVLVESPVARRVLQRLSAPEASPAVEEPEAPRLTALLAELNPGVARNAAASALLRVWNLASVSDYPDSDEVDAIGDFLDGNGLDYEAIEPAIDQLLAINRPAFVRMRHGQEMFWLALLRVDGARFTLSARHGETHAVARSEFSEHYAWQAVVPWRDAEPKAPDLLQGRTGQKVAELKDVLRALGRLRPNDTGDTYGVDTARAVARIQAETGMLVDGIAGRQVRMVLSGWLGEQANPLLQPRETELAAAASPDERKPEEVAPGQVTAAAGPPVAAAESAPGVRTVDAQEAEEAAPAEQAAGEESTEVFAPGDAAGSPETSLLPAVEAETQPEPAAQPAPEPVNDTESLVVVQELPEPSGDGELAPLDATELKQSTPPAVTAPLLPHTE